MLIKTEFQWVNLELIKATFKITFPNLIPVVRKMVPHNPLLI